MSIQRCDSSAYWNSDAWDPDQRVYVGSAIDGCDKVAVELDKDAHPAHSKIDEPGQDKDQEFTGMKESTSSPSFWDQQCAGIETPKTLSTFGVASGTTQPLLPPVSPAVANPEQAGQKRASVQFKDGESTDYWDMAGTGALPQKKDVKESEPSEEIDESPSGGTLKRANSSAYWFAEAWDPDERVYVGASSGQTNHLIAVLETGGEAISRAWSGGLVSKSLNFEGGPGTILTLSEFMGDSPSVKDLYDIEARSCGAGAFAEVRPAVHRKSGTRCVVKALSKMDVGPAHKVRVEDQGGYARLLKMTQEAPHDNVVRFVDFLEGPEHYYVVMEELLGSDLLQQAETYYPLSETYCQNVMRQILSALVHLHETIGICHRDIKMANFRFRAEGNESGLAVLDLQFALSLGCEWDKLLCGTPALIAPEVVAKTVKQEHMAAMDMWSAGVVFYRLLNSGDYPFENEEEVKSLGKFDDAAQSLLEKVLTDPKLTSMSEMSVSLLRQLLTLDPAARPTAKQALAHPWFSSAVAP